MLVRKANWEDPDQAGAALYVWAFFCWQLVFKILEHLPYFIYSQRTTVPVRFMYCYDKLYLN